MKIKPIRTKKDYKNAIKRIDELILKNPAEGSNDFDELDILGSLVWIYEEKHFPIEASDPIEVVKIVMEEKGLKAKDLVPYFGSKGNVSEFLNGKRGLSILAIKGLHNAFGIPLNALIN